MRHIYAMTLLKETWKSGKADKQTMERSVFHEQTHVRIIYIIYWRTHVPIDQNEGPFL